MKDQLHITNNIATRRCHTPTSMSRRRCPSASQLVLLLLSLLSLLIFFPSPTKAIRNNVFTKINHPFKKEKYTPLLFFTVPNGISPECQIMEKRVAAVESALGVRIQRFDVMRNRMASALHDRVNPTRDKTLPFLYHRESRQWIVGPADVRRIRAWAKGRYLPALAMSRDMDLLAEDGKKKKKKKGRGSTGGLEDGSMLVNEEDEALDQEEILRAEMEEALMSPIQRRGREAMRKRMEEGRRKSGKRSN